MVMQDLTPMHRCSDPDAVVLHFAVAEVILGTLSEHNPSARFDLGRISLFALVAGVALSRLLPEFEAWIRGRRRNN